MNQSPLIQSCFTMQMFFYQMLQNMLIITCSTNFQGAINTYQNFFQLFSRKVSVHINCSTSWLPLLSQLPSPPALWSIRTPVLKNEDGEQFHHSRKPQWKHGNAQLLPLHLAVAPDPALPSPCCAPNLIKHNAKGLSNWDSLMPIL